MTRRAASSRPYGVGVERTVSLAGAVDASEGGSAGADGGGGGGGAAGLAFTAELLEAGGETLLHFSP
jgi:hypothetical protein